MTGDMTGVVKNMEEKKRFKGWDRKEARKKKKERCREEKRDTCGPPQSFCLFSPKPILQQVSERIGKKPKKDKKN